MIKYLLKFVSAGKYADDLINGKLFMRPANYYHQREQGDAEGQNDFAEAAISHEICMYTHSTVPIYCMYAVKDTDIKNGRITIPKRCIQDFKCEQGYIVKIDFPPFEQMLSQIQSNGYMVCAGLVNYHNISTMETYNFIINDSLKNLFIKRPQFSYQNEFRIVVAKSVYAYGEPPIDHIEYYFPQRLGNIAAKLAVPDLLRQDGDYILTV